MLYYTHLMSSTCYVCNHIILLITRLVVVGWFRRVLTPSTHQYSLYFTKSNIIYNDTYNIVNNIDNNTIQYTSNKKNVSRP